MSMAKSIVGALLRLVPTPNPSAPASASAGMAPSSTGPNTKICTSLWPRRSSSQRRPDRGDSGDLHGSLVAGRAPRVHGPDPEGGALLVSRELPDSGGCRGDATRLAQQPENRSFVESPLSVRSHRHHVQEWNAS